MKGTSHDQAPRRILLLLVPSGDVIRVTARAVELARSLGAELRARLVADLNLQRAANLPMAGVIRSESGIRGAFSPEEWERHLRHLEAQVRAFLLREAAGSALACRMELEIEPGPEGEEEWVVLADASALRPGGGATGVRRVYLFLPPVGPPRKRIPVAGVVALVPPTERALWRVHEILRHTGHREPLLVFTREPLRCQRELAGLPGVAGFVPLRAGLDVPDRLFGEWARQGVSVAVLLVPDAVEAVTGSWGRELMRRSPVPLVFLQAD